MPTLPVELFRYTLEQVPLTKRDLCSVARVSLFFRSEAERRLYNHVEAESYVDIVKICKSICKRERYASLVQRFDIRLDILDPIWYHVTTPKTSSIFVRTFIRLISDSLQRMVSLKILHIFIPEGLAYLKSSCLGLLEQSTFRLTTLGSMFAIDRHFLSFLAKQPDITCLELYNDRPFGPHIGVVPIDILPRLTTLGTHFYEDSFQFISNRPITNLAFGFNTQQIQHFAHSLHSVRVLDIARLSPAEYTLEMMVEVMPELETVCLLYESIGTDGHISLTLRLLAQFPKLSEIEWGQSVKWNQVYRPQVDVMASHLETYILPRLDAKFPHLRSVKYRQWEFLEREEKEVGWERQELRWLRCTNFEKVRKNRPQFSERWSIS